MKTLATVIIISIITVNSPDIFAGSDSKKSTTKSKTPHVIKQSAHLHSISTAEEFKALPYSEKQDAWVRITQQMVVQMPPATRAKFTEYLREIQPEFTDTFSNDETDGAIDTLQSWLTTIGEYASTAAYGSQKALKEGYKFSQKTYSRGKQACKKAIVYGTCAYDTSKEQAKEAMLYANHALQLFKHATHTLHYEVALLYYTTIGYFKYPRLSQLAMNGAGIDISLDCHRSATQLLTNASIKAQHAIKDTNNPTQLNESMRLITEEETYSHPMLSEVAQCVRDGSPVIVDLNEFVDVLGASEESQIALFQEMLEKATDTEIKIISANLDEAKKEIKEVVDETDGTELTDGFPNCFATHTSDTPKQRRSQRIRNQHTQKKNKSKPPVYSGHLFISETIKDANPRGTFQMAQELARVIQIMKAKNLTALEENIKPSLMSADHEISQRRFNWSKIKATSEAALADSQARTDQRKKEQLAQWRAENAKNSTKACGFQKYYHSTRGKEETDGKAFLSLNVDTESTESIRLLVSLDLTFDRILAKNKVKKYVVSQ